MQTALIMTVLGPDRPGIVEALSTLVADAGGNWLESSMSHLGGHFAGIVQVSVPTDHVALFREKVEKMAEEGLACTIQDAFETEADPGICFSLEIMGQDRPGIVRAISDLVVQAGGNVEKFVSSVESAAMSGEQLFKAEVIVCFDSETKVDGLEQRLSEIGNELTLDVSWQADNR